LSLRKQAVLVALGAGIFVFDSVEYVRCHD
jgi:hypothetical protein